MIFYFSPTVSAEILKGSLTTMERQIQRLENDIENFPKTDDQQDKFVEKMSISFFYCYGSRFHTQLGFIIKFPLSDHTYHLSILERTVCHFADRSVSCLCPAWQR